jgi:hypothetical protein
MKSNRFSIITIILVLTSYNLFCQNVSVEKSPQQIYKILNPAVVTIVVYNRSNQKIASGSGVLISDDGLVLTNLHVVQNGIFYDVRISGNRQGRSIPARPAKASTTQDLAMLRLSTEVAIKPVHISTKIPQIGTKVFAIGSPFELEGSLSEGIVSQIRRDDNQIWIQTTAQISPGSSGGGLFTESGELIGLTTMTIKGGQSLNFAISCSKLSELSTVESFQSFAGLDNSETPTLNIDGIKIKIGMTPDDIKTILPANFEIQNDKPNVLTLFRMSPPTSLTAYFSQGKLYYAQRSWQTGNDRISTIQTIIDMIAYLTGNNSETATITSSATRNPDSKYEIIEIILSNGRGIQLGIYRSQMEGGTEISVFDINEIIRAQ